MTRAVAALFMSAVASIATAQQGKVRAAGAARASTSHPAPPPRDLSLPCPASEAECTAPVPRREFRGVWVATVDNIDWPSQKGLSTAEQQRELRAILDAAAAHGLNAVIFQVRPAGDALYASKIEPWSEYLTGRQGKAPDPFWDPLAFAVKEAHARGLELHAWFNPYRAKHPSAKGPLAKSHLARRRPDLVKKYGTHLWMDPGEPAVRERTVKVVLDVVKRYDIDGVHLDDYFYPYKEKRASGSTEFPDDASWKRYRKKGGKLDRDDWRRHNVDLLIEALHDGIAKAKPWVKFGVSPFGIWRPGNPESVTGLDAYTQLYADSRKWLREGWVDYFTPQLYWAVDKQGQRYPELLAWWTEQNVQQRHLWPGNYTSKVTSLGSATAWRRDELVAQVRATRAQGGATGNVHFSMRAFLDDPDSVATALARLVYDEPALVPASPWLLHDAPSAPKVAIVRGDGDDQLTLAPTGKDVVRWWLVQARFGSAWQSRLFDGARRSVPLSEIGRDPLVPAEVIAVTAIDRADNASEPVAVRVP
jgi:uncharacterized lipoprotein YddW (UPF0748 family)